MLTDIHNVLRTYLAGMADSVIAHPQRRPAHAMHVQRQKNLNIIML